MDKIWTCKIGEVPSVPSGADGPMRDAVADAYRQITGQDPAFIFSGWGGELEECERAVVENRLPILATRTDATPVALAHISLEDDGPYIDLQVLNGETLQPTSTPVPLYTHPPATDVAALVEAAYREGWRDGLASERPCSPYRTDDDDWADSDAFAALAPFMKGQP